MLPTLSHNNWLAILVVALPLACSHPAEQAPPQAQEIYIENWTETQIQSIRFEPCDKPGSGHQILHGPIDERTRVSIPLVRECVDLQALDIQGRVLGEQKKVRMIPGMVWRIYRWQ